MAEEMEVMQPIIEIMAAISKTELIPELSSNNSKEVFSLNNLIDVVIETILI